MSYGAEQRLEEQVNILAKDATPTAIVQMSVLGEPAVPYLVRLLTAVEDDGEGESTKALDDDEADAVVRALGMIAHPSAIPVLVARFKGLEGENSYSSAKAAFRATANALRKIGTPDALQAIVDRLHDFDPEHAASTVKSFGVRGQAEVLAMLEQQTTGPQLPAAIMVASRLAIEDAGPRLLQIAHDAPSPQAALLAAQALAHIPNIAPTRLVSALARALDEQAKNTSRGYGGYSSDTPIWQRAEFSEALLAAIYHTQGVKVTPLLLPLAVKERPSRAREYYSDSRQPIADALVSFGQPALAYVEGRAIEAYDDATKDVATEIAHRIRKRDAGRVPNKEEPGRRSAYFA